MNASTRDIEKYTKEYFKNKVSRSCISNITNNVLESLSKEIKRITKVRILFPGEISIEKILITLFVDYSNNKGQRRFPNMKLFEFKKEV